MRPDERAMRAVLVLVGLVALAVYVLSWLPAPAAHWPLWDVRVYWWGGRQAATGGGALYAPGAPFASPTRRSPRCCSRPAGPARSAR